MIKDVIVRRPVSECRSLPEPELNRFGLPILRTFLTGYLDRSCQVQPFPRIARYPVLTYLHSSPRQPRAVRASSGKRGHVHRDPGREALPDCGVAERIANLLYDDHETCRPDR